MNLIENLVVLGCLLGFSALTQAQQTCYASIPASTPSADFADNGNGTVTHSRTGLMWKRCAEGQTWSGTTCTGTPSRASWGDALKSAVGATAAGYSDWRVPNIKELKSIVEEKCGGPAINASVFPNTPSGVTQPFFWAASPDVYYSDAAWWVSFGGSGSAYSGSKSSGYAVRLVRAGASFGSFDSLGMTTAPVCNLSALPASITAGGSSTLTASCSPVATSYAWTGGSCAGTTDPTCTVTPSSTTTYTVAGSNSAGTGSASTTTVTVTALTAQTINFTNPGAKTLGTAPFALSATGGASGNPVTFTSQTASICTVSGSTVTGIAAGTCTIAANQAGNANYYAAPQVTQNITVDPVSQGVSFAPGWNLLGNSLNQAFSVVPVFSDTALVTTVWKWDAITAGWQFYAPSLDAATLQAYAASKGYGVLSVINPGEGYWVNAKASASLGTQAGAAFTLTAANLATGWNLVATGNDVLPSAFNLSLSATPPTPGTIPINLTTLWAWDNPLSKWYFYAPSLAAQGGTVLIDYITSKGYLDFTASGKLLGAGTGFWVNRP